MKSKKMRVIGFVAAVCLTASLHAQVQKETFAEKREYMSEVLDIVWKQPKGFSETEVKQPVWGYGRGDGYYFGSKIEYAFRSKDGHCLILYPNMSLLVVNLLDPLRIGDPALARSQMEFDLERFSCKADTFSGQERSESSFLGQIVTLQVDNCTFNADTVWVAQYPVMPPYERDYTYCIGYYMYKAGRVPMVFRILLTEEGRKERDKYLKRFFRSVRYGDDDNWIYDDIKAKQLYKRRLSGRKR